MWGCPPWGNAGLQCAQLIDFRVLDDAMTIP